MEERILVIDRDQKTLDSIRRELVVQGHDVAVAANGEDGLARARSTLYDLVILDPEVPGVGGLEICRRLRYEGQAVPILMLSSRSGLAERIAGLDAGADDYLVKPFAMEELLARSRALLRRYRGGFEGLALRMGDLFMNTATREVRRGSQSLSLTAREFALLELFLRHPRQVLTREIIYEHVWGFDMGGESNIIEVYVRHLRAKLEARGESRLLQTVRGVGYVLRES
ncbi:MAG TPA: response regulator transcription factor [Anaerolineae bacterium]|nr:response regulator transcription factor [Anaerolineae bacterium]HNS52895.1 response regulator transcription factor [Anaerolineae bacterium]